MVGKNRQGKRSLNGREWKFKRKVEGKFEGQVIAQYSFP